MAAFTKQRVELTTDLTRYDKRLTIGEKGYTIPNAAFSMWARSSDRFAAVKFDNGAENDISYGSMKIIQ
jgi:hypothetical protein